MLADLSMRWTFSITEPGRKVSSQAPFHWIERCSRREEMYRGGSTRLSLLMMSSGTDPSPACGAVADGNSVCRLGNKHNVNKGDLYILLLQDCPGLLISWALFAGIPLTLPPVELLDLPGGIYEGRPGPMTASGLFPMSLA